MVTNIPFDSIEYCLLRMPVTSGVDADTKAWVQRWIRENKPTEADTIAAAQVTAALTNKSSPTMNLCSEQGRVVGGDLPVPTMGDFFGMGEAPQNRPFSLVPDAAAGVFKAGTDWMYRKADEVVNTPSKRDILDDDSATMGDWASAFRSTGAE